MVNRVRIAAAVCVAGVLTLHAQQPTTETVPPASVPSAAKGLDVRRERVLARYGDVQKETKRRLVLTPGIGRISKTPINRPDSNTLRFHFRITNPDTGLNWVIQIVRPTDDVVVWTQSGTNLKAESSQSKPAEFWSDEIAGSRASIEVLTVDGGSRPQIEIAETVLTGPLVRPQGIVEPDERIEVRNPQRGIADWPVIQHLAKAVGRLRFGGDDGFGYYCTGFLFTPELLLTNDHCIQSDAEMRSALVDFNYLTATAPLAPLRFRELVAHDRTLDYSLLRLSAPSSIKPLRLMPTEVTNARQLLLIEHPAGEIKQVSIADCVVRGIEVIGVDPLQKTDFGHRCDTLGGSSGSPVLDGLSSGNVIGLHHLGYLEDDPDPVNQAVKIGLVLDDIRRRRPDIAAELPSTTP
jgi:hypothetical protein